MTTTLDSDFKIKYNGQQHQIDAVEGFLELMSSLAVHHGRFL